MKFVMNLNLFIIPVTFQHSLKPLKNKLYYFMDVIYLYHEIIGYRVYKLSQYKHYVRDERVKAGGGERGGV